MNHFFTKNYNINQNVDFRFFSDLHLEFDTNFTIPNLKKNQVIIFAGDINSQGRKKTLNIRTLNLLMPLIENGNHIIWVNGNHDYYGNKIHKVDELFQALDDKYENFHFLNDSSVLINEIEFLGGTLWTDIDNQNPLIYREYGAVKSTGEYISEEGIADYKKIFVKRENPHVHYNTLKTLDTVTFHLKTLNFIKSRIGKHPKQVVVTHHTPSIDFIDTKRWKKNSITHYNFYSELDELAENFDFWVAGHSHKKVNKKKKNVHYLSNPRGYVGTDDLNDVVNEFEPELIITVEG
jgi:predicted phosphodiesterase